MLPGNLDLAEELTFQFCGLTQFIYMHCPEPSCLLSRASKMGYSALTDIELNQYHCLLSCYF